MIGGFDGPIIHLHSLRPDARNQTSSVNIRHRDLHVTLGTGVIDGIQDIVQYTLNPEPARGAKDNDGNAAIGKILLMLQVGVCCYQNLEVMIFRLPQQISIFDIAPSQFIRG